MINIDKSINKILGNKKKQTKNNSNSLFNVNKIIGTSSKNTKGASIQKQNQWKNMSINQRNIMRRMLPDRDGDRVPDMFDCSPNNIMRQDTLDKAKYVTLYHGTALHRAPSITKKGLIPHKRGKDVYFSPSIAGAESYGAMGGERASNRFPQGTKSAVFKVTVPKDKIKNFDNFFIENDSYNIDNKKVYIKNLPETMGKQFIREPEFVSQESIPPKFIKQIPQEKIIKLSSKQKYRTDKIEEEELLNQQKQTEIYGHDKRVIRPSINEIKEYIISGQNESEIIWHRGASRTDYEQAKKELAIHNIYSRNTVINNLMSDTDGDGVVNVMDCDPNNETKQGPFDNDEEQLKKEKRRIAQKKYYEKNKEKYKEYRERPEAKEYQKEYQKKYQKEYYSNPENLKKKQKAGKKYFDNPDNRLKASLYRREYYKHPEVNARIKEYHKRPEIKEQKREYRQRPEVQFYSKVYQEEYHKRPEIQEKIKKNRQRPEIQEQHKKYMKEYHKRPEIQEQQREYKQRPEVKKKQYEYNKLYRERPEIKEKAREYQKKYRELMKAKKISQSEDIISKEIIRQQPEVVENKQEYYSPLDPDVQEVKTKLHEHYKQRFKEKDQIDNEVVDNIVGDDDNDGVSNAMDSDPENPNKQ